MECVLQIVSVRRNIFISETALSSFLSTTLVALTYVLTSRFEVVFTSPHSLSLGLQCPENHHTFSRVLGQLKSPQSLILMTLNETEWPTFVSSLLEFTVQSVTVRLVAVFLH